MPQQTRETIPTGLIGREQFPHRHLLAISALMPWEISFLLDEAEHWVSVNRAHSRKHDDRLGGLTQINAFFENSTRTLLSFEIAADRGEGRLPRPQCRRWLA